MNPSPSSAYPGEAEANRLGYTFQTSSKDRKKASYTRFFPGLKKTLHLTVISYPNGDLDGQLEAFAGVVQIRVGKFAFPNVNFALFEKQIINILESLK